MHLNPHAKHARPSGYTLIELLIVIGIVAVLAVAALTGIIKSQAQFQFRGVVKETTNIIREARSYALANKTVANPDDPSDMIVPHLYGAHIDPTAGEITIFADMPNIGEKGKFDPTRDTIFATYELEGDYHYWTYDEDVPTEPSKTITIFYEPTTAKFSIKDSAPTTRYIAIQIFESADADKAAPTREKFIVIFKVAGNPETFASLLEITEITE